MNNKEVIYIDIDDEVTAVIEKIKTSETKLVVLALPKKASVFLSNVNIKLIKKAADNTHKKIILVTSDPSVIALAGASKIYVAKNMHSKPFLPIFASNEELKVSDNPNIEDSSVDSIGEDDIQIDDIDEKVMQFEDESEAEELDTSTAQPKTKKNKKLKVPNFKKFQRRMILGSFIVLLLIIGWIYGFKIAPKAQINITTVSQKIESNLALVADDASKDVDIGRQIIPIAVEKDQTTLSEQFTATGTKDLGTKASGNITVTNCSSEAITIAAGSGFSSGGLTFISQNELSLSDGNFTGGGVCKNTGTHISSVKVVAREAGESYNLASGSEFTIAGQNSAVEGVGAAMTGGSSRVVKVVTESDIETAKQKLTVNEEDIRKTLVGELEKNNFIAISSTFKVEKNDPVITPAAGTEAESGQVTMEVNYEVIGYKESDIQKFLDEDLSSKIDISKQKITDYGLKDALVTYKEGQKNSLNVTTSAIVIPVIDEQKLKQSIKGLSISEAIQIIKKHPGVEDASVEFSPFWVNKVPSNPNKSTITTQEK